MKVSNVPPTVRKFIEKRLLSVDPPCDGFWLAYVNDGSPLRNVNIPQSGRMEKVVKALFDELAEAAIDHAMTSDGMHKFSIEAKGPAPERRSLGSMTFALTTQGSGVPTNWESVDVGPVEALDSPFPAELFPVAAEKRESLMARNGEWGEIAKLYEAMQKASNSHLPAATMKVALDYAHNSGRLLVEAVPKIMVTLNDMLQFMMKGEQDRRETDLETRKLMADLLTRREERRAELRRELRNDKQRHRRMAKVERILEAILPGLIENVTGESAVIQLIREIPENELKMIMGHISPKARKLIQQIFARAKAREDKIRARKKGRRQDRHERTA